MKKTKVICTVGPSTDSLNLLVSMIQSGMNVARFNFSHGNHEDHAKRIALVREAATKAGQPVGLLLDTKGPEIRVGLFEQGKVYLKAGQKFILMVECQYGTEEKVAVSYPDLYQLVQIGQKILLADGLITLEVEKIVERDIYTVVKNSGPLSDRKRVAVPGCSLPLPPLSEQDMADLRFGLNQEMDFVAASFIQRASDVTDIRRFMEEVGFVIPIISKIENAEGVANIDEILKVTDGVMVARGDLGVEIPAEDVPILQKSIIKKCNDAGKPVITATQMLESMMTNPRPTRAEASDVANAIYDGSDCIMLSGETASGNYPLEAVQMMAQIAERTEEALAYDELVRTRALSTPDTTTEAISHATVHIAQELKAAAILTATESGFTPQMVSKYRPKAPIIAVTPHERTQRKLLLNWGVCPLLGPSSRNSDEMVQKALETALAAKVIHDGDLIVITAGVPVGTAGTTNMIRVHVVGNILLSGKGIGNKSVTGKTRIIRGPEDFCRETIEEDILVMEGLDESWANLAIKAKAIITEEGGLTSPAAILGVSFGVPVVIGVANAVETIPEGLIVTVDTGRGLIYQGEINAR